MCFSCCLPHGWECALNLLLCDQHAGMFSTHFEVKTTECVTPVKSLYFKNVFSFINGREHVIYTFSNPETISEFPWLNNKVKNGPLFFAYYDIFILEFSSIRVNALFKFPAIFPFSFLKKVKWFHFTRWRCYY